MDTPLFIGLFAEGTTDERFLKNVISRALDDVLFECHGNIEVYEFELLKGIGETFAEKVLCASGFGDNFAMNILFVHTDADNRSLNDTYENKIIPAKEALSRSIFCKIMIPVVPIHETEAWLLADKELFKKYLNTTKSDNDLKINGNPEAFPDPKTVIEEAISLVSKEKTKRRRGEISISDLYEPIGNEIPLEKLRELYSFQKFEEEVRSAFKTLGYLAP